MATALDFFSDLFKAPIPESGVGGPRQAGLEIQMGVGEKILSGAVAGGISKAFEFFQTTKLGQEAKQEVVTKEVGAFFTQPFVWVIGGLLVLLFVLPGLAKLGAR